jgi:hypothetical protein
MIPIPPHTAIGFLLDHTKEVIECINDVKDAGKDQKALSDELVATQTVLSQLNSHADDDGWKETMGALCAVGGPFDQLTVELKSMEKKLKPPTGMFKKSGKALTWHFTKDGVKKHFDRIERIKALLQLAVQNNHRSIPPKQHSNFRELTKALQQDMVSVKKMLKGMNPLNCKALLTT